MEQMLGDRRALDFKCPRCSLRVCCARHIIVELCLRLVDIELTSARHELDRHGWVDIEDARRYQQETYTSLLRMRLGPGRL
jgi:hypothetical protein